MDTLSHQSTVVLVGFSTAGKSHYLREICKHHDSEFDFLDSDQFVSKNYGGHIYNVFLELGHEEAIKFIENKENEFIDTVLMNNQRPQLIAAGPFLVQRTNWPNFVKERKPYVIHINKIAEHIYDGLIKRKAEQKQNPQLDSSSPNFGCWDKDVTTEFNGRFYVDLSKSQAVENIQKLLDIINPKYIEYRNVKFESEKLNDKNNLASQELQKLIVTKLKEYQ